MLVQLRTGAVKILKLLVSFREGYVEFWTIHVILLKGCVELRSLLVKLRTLYNSILKIKNELKPISIDDLQNKTAWRRATGMTI